MTGVAQVRHGTSSHSISRCATARRALVLGLIGLAAIAGRASAGDVAGRPIAPPAAPALDTAPLADQSDSAAANNRPIAAPSGSFTGDAVRTVVALGAVLALALVVRHVAKRLVDPLAARRPSGVVQVLGRFPVAKGQSILLINVGTRVICAHQSAGVMRTLCEFSDQQEIALLRGRIEAGTPGREQFERELVRSLEREEPVAARPARALPQQRSTPIVTETIDLTKRRPTGGAAMRLVGVRA